MGCGCFLLSILISTLAHTHTPHSFIVTHSLQKVSQSFVSLLSLFPFHTETHTDTLNTQTQNVFVQSVAHTLHLALNKDKNVVKP